jgi:hypothetical protein
MSCEQAVNGINLVLHFELCQTSGYESDTKVTDLEFENKFRGISVPFVPFVGTSYSGTKIRILDHGRRFNGHDIFGVAARA